MSKSVKQLIFVLDKEYEFYKDYLEQVQKKTEWIIAGAIKELDHMQQEEQEQMLAMMKIDKLRTAIVGNILLEKKVPWVENISELVCYIEEPEKTRLIEQKEKLGKLLEEIKKVNQFNTQLLQQALDYVDFQLNILTGQEESGSIYGSNADEKELKGSHFIFDAKA